MGRSKRVNLKGLALRVARSVGADRKVTLGFICEIIDQVVVALLAGEEVHLRGLGRFHWRLVPKATVVTGRRRRSYAPGMKLRFTPSQRLRRRRKRKMSDEGMTKLGVVLDDQKTKKADTNPETEERICPVCGKALDDAGACPEHGTEPFEPDTAP
jgi:nucleoid DNA-binding protein